MHKRRVVITGLSVIASNGVGKDAFWAANKAGISGINTVTHFDPSGFDSHIGGEIKGFDPVLYMSAEIVKRVDRFVHIGLACAKMAIADSGLNIESEDRSRIGVVMGSGLGGVLYHEEQILAGYEKGAHRLNPMSVPKISPNAVSSHIAIAHGLLGPNMVISTACASGTHGVGEALRKIQYGETDICLTGGVEAPLSRFTFGAYCSLRVVSKRNDDPKGASRPFDRGRDGFVLGEGGAVLILEELDHALKRNAPIYAELIGYASNSGAQHMVMPDAEGTDAMRVMSDTLKDAQLTLDDIDYINAHATSTGANDRAETKAIKGVFGKRAYGIPVSATKSMIGHTIGAAGGIEAAVCALAIKDGFIPPTINYTDADPDCDLDYVPNVGRKQALTKVLSNSFGFGNCNACLAFAKY